jgi:chitinase
MVFPPSTLPQGTSATITLDLYTATLEVGGSTTTVVATPAQRTITVTVIEYFNYYVKTGQQPGQPITLLPSFQAPPIPVVVTGPDGSTTTRTISPPPLGRLPRPASSGTSGSPGPGEDPDETGAPGGVFFPPTRTPEPILQDVFLTGTDFFATVPIGTVQPPRPIPVPWPTGIIKPVIDINLPVPGGGSRRPCRSWFFFICISWGELDLNINFWDIVLPPGIIGPGPPPLSLFQFPPGWRLGCGANENCLPPWPRLTVGADGQFLSVPPEPAACEPTTAMLTIESTSYGTTTTQGTVRTTATQTLSREFPLVGCAVEDAATATTTQGCDAQPTPRALAADGAGTALEPIEEPEQLVARQTTGCNNPTLIDAVIIPTDHFANQGSLRSRLTQEARPDAFTGRKLESFNVIEAPALGFTAFIYLTKVREDYLTGQLLGNFGLTADYLRIDAPVAPPGWTPKKRSAEGDDGQDNNNNNNNNNTIAVRNKPEKLGKRASDFFAAWTQSHISVPPWVDWHDTSNTGYLDLSSGAESWRYQRHESECEGQYVGFVLTYLPTYPARY